MDIRFSECFVPESCFGVEFLADTYMCETKSKSIGTTDKVT